jgi:catechol 2,3-dioxygenase-like lactoylglutathione lyase family enzyme
MSHSRPPFTQAITAVTPYLRVADLARSLEFYVTMLGFLETWRHQPEPDLPALAAITRGHVTIVLSERDDVAAGSLVYLHTTELDTVFHELAPRDVTLDLAPADMPWGMRELALRDPDGNVVRIGQRLLV